MKGWCLSTIRAVLTRKAYVGVYEWNKTKKKNDYGKLDVKDRPKEEWETAPHPRIIDDKLWQRVQSRREASEHKTLRFKSGRLSGRPPKHAIINLLAGMATCSVCGGGLIAESGGVPSYICNRRRGNGSCTNTHRIPVTEMNEAVLQAVEEHALTPNAIEQVIIRSERDGRAGRQGHPRC